ncbi:hypothetical protein HK096_006089, partial [Nowakowskiella sp. JEL0078]
MVLIEGIPWEWFAKRRVIESKKGYKGRRYCKKERDDDESYACVSHVWGNCELIGIKDRNGMYVQPLMLNENIAKIVWVQQMISGQYDNDIPTWMDIYSINQSDDVDVERQVGIIDKIFSSAKLCYVCIEERDVYNSFKQIKDTYNMNGNYAMYLDEVTRDILRLVNDSVYGSRIWTLQEFLLSKDRKFVFCMEDENKPITVSGSWFSMTKYGINKPIQRTVVNKKTISEVENERYKRHEERKSTAYRDQPLEYNQYNVRGEIYDDHNNFLYSRRSSASLENISSSDSESEFSDDTFENNEGSVGCGRSTCDLCNKDSKFRCRRGWLYIRQLVLYDTRDSVSFMYENAYDIGLGEVYMADADKDTISKYFGKKTFQFLNHRKYETGAVATDLMKTLWTIHFVKGDTRYSTELEDQVYSCCALFNIKPSIAYKDVKTQKQALFQDWFVSLVNLGFIKPSGKIDTFLSDIPQQLDTNNLISDLWSIYKDGNEIELPDDNYGDGIALGMPVPGLIRRVQQGDIDDQDSEDYDYYTMQNRGDMDDDEDLA